VGALACRCRRIIDEFWITWTQPSV